MSTKTMRPPSRRVQLTLGNSSDSKRKERDHASPRPKSSPTVTKLPNEKSPNPVSTNILLAGYLAHEFLSKGTLLGRSLSPREESQQQKYDRYVELSLLLKTEGAHLVDIVNPNQLAHFLKL